MTYATPSNQKIAQVLETIADLLEVQQANPFKVRAYRNGAQLVRRQRESLAAMVRSGDGQALQTIPNIGERLAGLIEEYVKTGKSGLLQRLQGEIAPEDVFEQVPGVGKELARRIVRELDIRTLEELEHAAHDGSLGRLEGFGKRRVEAIQVGLAGMLSGYARKRMERLTAEDAPNATGEPPVALLLDIDAEYRRKAADGVLRKIAPKRFNPAGEAWLPVLHTDREGWSFTAMYSNTARAHELDKTRDWVVLYYEKDKGREAQVTVVTQATGALAGKRVIRGREGECREYYGPYTRQK